jgi:hypothetical protein
MPDPNPALTRLNKLVRSLAHKRGFDVHTFAILPGDGEHTAKLITIPDEEAITKTPEQKAEEAALAEMAEATAVADRERDLTEARRQAAEFLTDDNGGIF